MKRPRQAVIAAWALLVGATSIPGLVSAQTGVNGFLAPTACISPAVLIVLALTPAETLVTRGTELVFRGNKK